jgi:hypothetical protein
MMPNISLLDAADVLDAIASSRAPDKATVLSAALAVDTLSREGQGDRDLLDAAAALKILATGGTLELDDAGRLRAAQLASHLRLAADNF